MTTSDDAHEKIVVGVDGSPSSSQALRWAARQARLTGSALHAVIAWSWPPTYGGALVTHDDLAGEARHLLDHTLSATLEPGVAEQVQVHVVEGHPVQVLVDAAADADLLVVGSRGHGGFPGMLLGAVSQHVAAHAACPVVIVQGLADDLRS